MKANLILFIIFFISCSRSVNKASDKPQESNLYRVYKIDSINIFYLVYCEKGNEKYEILSKKGGSKSKEVKKIKIGNSYNFALKAFPSEKENEPLTKQSLLVNCYTFEGNTKICRERDVHGLFSTTNLIGLYYVSSASSND